MFTGIIEEAGRVLSLEFLDGSALIKIEADMVTKGSTEGDSIAVNGVCLTALNIGPDAFSFHCSPETLERTTLGRLRPGSKINLERALTPATRLGGHIVQGHVDARGQFRGYQSLGECRTIQIGYPRELGKYLVFKGSVAVEGISLTIAGLEGAFFEVAVIPRTWDLTNLSSLKEGDEVNLEADIIAKYVEKIMSSSTGF